MFYSHRCVSKVRTLAKNYLCSNLLSEVLIQNIPYGHHHLGTPDLDKRMKHKENLYADVWAFNFNIAINSLIMKNETVW